MFPRGKLAELHYASALSFWDECGRGRQRGIAWLPRERGARTTGPP